MHRLEELTPSERSVDEPHRQNGNYATDSSMDLGGGNGRSLIVAALLVVLIVLNIVLTAIVLGRPSSPAVTVMPATATGGPQGQGSGTQMPVVNVITSGDSGTDKNPPGSYKTKAYDYLVQYGHDYGLYEYIDDGGFHRGFFLELVKEVCEAAEVTCGLVFDTYAHVFLDAPARHTILGIGLQSQYYDACIGWVPTVERIHVASFSAPFLKVYPSFFWVKKGKSLSVTDFTNKKIGFIAGWANDETCVARNYNSSTSVPLTAGQIVYAFDPSELEKSIVNGTVDAGFGTELDFNGLTDHVEKISAPGVHCYLGGNAMVSRKDSPFPDVWNRGFMKIFSNGKFEKLCKSAAAKHGHRGDIHCIESYNYNV